mmetsp:Transcript_14374/g.38504  ORF Transcript_14374/g.38504 Transcript_14374/m.38504 type:complete len:612 (+) Transcript_14374:88-1923(+)
MKNAEARSFRLNTRNSSKMESWWNDPDQRLGGTTQNRGGGPAVTTDSAQSTTLTRRTVPREKHGAQNVVSNAAPTPLTAKQPGSAPAREARHSAVVSTRRPLSNQVLAYETEPLDKRYELGKKLGEGAFGVVHEAKSLASRKVYACKSIPKTKLATPADRAGVANEVSIMQSLRGADHIVQMRAAFEDHADVHVVMDLCRGGELFDVIVNTGIDSDGGGFTEAHAANTLRALLKAVATLHSHRIVHRDLKPENLLLTEPVSFGGAQRGNVDVGKHLIVTDFGLATTIRTPSDPERDAHSALSGACGTPYYVAPEVLAGKYGNKCDVWSIGCIAYLLLSGRPPFNGVNTESILAEVRAGRVDLSSAPWPRVSTRAKAFVRELLTYDARRRPQARQMLAHAWLQGNASAESSYRLQKHELTAMKEFVKLNHFKKAALLAVAHDISGRKELETLRRAFVEIDVDKSGTVSVAELVRWLRRHSGANGSVSRRKSAEDEDQLRTLVAAFDLDGSGELDYNEFLVATSHFRALNNVENLARAFRRMDTNGDGVLSLAEVQRALKAAGMDAREARETMLQYDTDHSGTIDYQEFVAMMQDGNTELEAAARVFKRLTFC